jgi:hypothetical protein
LSTTTIRMSEYFRQSNIDAEHALPQDIEVQAVLNVAGAKKKTSAEIMAIDASCWLSGKIDSAIANELVNRAENKLNEERQFKRTQEEKKKEKEWIHVSEITITLIPHIGLLKSHGGSRYNHRAVLMPFTVIVLLNRSGHFSPKASPTIARELLSPNANTTISPIGMLAIYDEFLSKNHFESVKTWKELLKYCEEMLNTVCGNQRIEGIDQDYVDSKQAVILCKSAPQRARVAIQAIYNGIIKGEKPSKAYEAITQQKPCALKPTLTTSALRRLSVQHYGQMTGAFSLSPKQRIALAYFLQGDSAGEKILAVNGPPGTGKTTLICAIVANLWVSAALEKKEPPIIAAASNNNQAITNILDSFAKIDEENIAETLRGRWLPELETYGLFCCAKGRGLKSGYGYYEVDNSGLFQDRQTMDYMKRAKQCFLGAFQAYSGQEQATLSSAVTLLHGKLMNVKKEVQAILKKLTAFERVQDKVQSTFISIEQLEHKIQNITNEQTLLTAALKRQTDLLEKYTEAFQQRKFALKHFSWLPYYRKNIELQNTLFMTKHNLLAPSFSDKDIIAQLKNNVHTAREKQARKTAELEQHEQTITAYITLEKSLVQWLKNHGQPSASLENFREQVEQCCDCQLRFKAFKLATHYWEARWLMETIRFVSSNDQDKRSPKKALRKWRRFAKLTPCLVSTFYMLPKYFTCYERKGDAWQNMPLYNEIDLLIVDEAGQANAEIACASFALAKRALVVGDTEQIEPIWCIHAGVDRANLLALKLLASEHQFVEQWLESGLLASSGNLMRVAQQQTPYHQYKNLRRGLYLTEHRRCFDTIISYCNDLVYQGVLEPLRGDPCVNPLFPPLAFIHSEGRSSAAGTSRVNTQQASEILVWLADNAPAIIADARTKDPRLVDCSNEEAIIKTIAIITPFSKQAYNIRRQLKAYDLPIKMTVGTVHALQGSERNLIIFSSVYGENHHNMSKFYDNGYNMLNVAVSRAKESFIVFGHSKVFGKNAKGTPSGLLRHRLEVV